MTWWWLSFADGDLPEGSQFIGAAIVEAHNAIAAIQVSHLAGCNPGGSVLVAEVPSRFGAPPAEWNHKLIRGKAEVDRMTQLWHGCGIVRADGSSEQSSS